MDEAPMIDPELDGWIVEAGTGQTFENVNVPFGGFKDSGLGRQNGIAGFDQYLETKSLAWPSA